MPVHNTCMSSCRDKQTAQTCNGVKLNASIKRPEWPTLAVAAVCYAGWVAIISLCEIIGPWPSAIILTGLLTLHSSLQHEIVHGHPFQHRRYNDALGFVPLGLFVAFERYRQIHLQHHHDPALTDPRDDPESNYLHPLAWDRLPIALRLVWRFNNTLLGRVIVGPALSLACLYWQDLQGLRRGVRRIRRAYLWHGAGLAIVATVLLAISTMPWWLYLICAYLALSLLKIRTFLEHCANAHVAHRTAIVEDRGPLALLFLNNNLHAVHHAHPGIAWYALPGFYRTRRAQFLQANNGYVYPSYWAVVCKYLVRQKDPVAHPISRRGRSNTGALDHVRPGRLHRADPLRRPDPLPRADNR